MGQQYCVDVFKKILCNLKKYFLMSVNQSLSLLWQKSLYYDSVFFLFFQDEDLVLIFWHKSKMDYSERQ